MAIFTVMIQVEGPDGEVPVEELLSDVEGGAIIHVSIGNEFPSGDRFLMVELHGGEQFVIDVVSCLINEGIPFRFLGERRAA